MSFLEGKVLEKADIKPKKMDFKAREEISQMQLISNIIN